MPAPAFIYTSIWEPSVIMCNHLSWGYLVFIISRARCLSVCVYISPFIVFCCRCRWYSTCSMSTGFRRSCNGWGLLLISSFVFISVAFCIKPFCVFRFLSAELTPGQIWKSCYLLWLKGCNTICGINRNWDINRSQRLPGPNTTT